MACYETRTIVRLADREAITLPDVRGATLRVLQGTLWVTEERQRSDFVLRAGDSFVVEFDGDTVIEARADARFAIVGARGRPLRLPRAQPALARFAAAVTAWLSPPRQVPYL
jgi:hypothetical protein